MYLKFYRIWQDIENQVQEKLTFCCQDMLEFITVKYY
jgi:hypothetical protein